VKALTTIGFDADDTLWHNERHFRLTQECFEQLLAGHAAPDGLHERVLEAERRNVLRYGYGAKSFTLSLVETAIEVTGGRVPATVIAEILATGRELMAFPVECFPGVAETLAALGDDYRLVLVTKGDLFDQERKLAQSGLGDHFHGVEIVSEKTPETYARVFSRHGTGAECAMMVGNSLKSDVLPALAAGSWAVHIPHELTWELEQAEEPEHAARFRRANHIREIPALAGTLERP
jgi:putative hydrolase of the HAD superfamily